MSTVEFPVEPKNDSPRSFEADRFSYQNDTTDHYRPGSGSHVVDYNGEKLGASRGVRAADRYRSALSNATFDRGVRALCASGQRCTTNMQCGFCREAGLRPVPEDGHEQFPSAVAQARQLWWVSMQELAPKIVFHEDAHKSSLGAMMLAAHVTGHNCLSSAFDGIFPRNVPHDVNTLSGVASWAKASKFKPGVEATAIRSLLIVRICENVEGAPVVTHVLSVFSRAVLLFNEITVSISGYTISTQCVSYEMALRAKTLSVVVDVGYNNPIQNECISRYCSSMPTGYSFCRDCGFTSVQDGHADRCRLSGPMTTMEIVYARAQFGDLMHRNDVLHALIDRRVPSSERTLRLAEYQSATSQAAFMRFAGYNGLDSVLATWFEAAYDYFRSYYWDITFETRPPFPVILITDLHPERLDPKPFAEFPVAPDYRSAWHHLLKVSDPDGARMLLDDPVKLAVRESRGGMFEPKLAYTRRFTKLPSPTRFYIRPVTGAKVYDNNAFLEIAHSSDEDAFVSYTPLV